MRLDGGALSLVFLKAHLPGHIHLVDFGGRIPPGQQQLHVAQGTLHHQIDILQDLFLPTHIVGEERILGVVHLNQALSVGILIAVGDELLQNQSRPSVGHCRSRLCPLFDSPDSSPWKVESLASFHTCA